MLDATSIRRPWTANPAPKKEDKDLSQWPKGTTQPVNQGYGFAPLLSLISTSENSMARPARQNIPSSRRIATWPAGAKPSPGSRPNGSSPSKCRPSGSCKKRWISKRGATKETAHLCRVKFDIIKFIAGKLHPEVWGDRPARLAQCLHDSSDRCHLAGAPCRTP